MIIVIARVRPHAERVNDLLGLLRDVQAASRQDDGCLNYGYYAEIEDGSSYIAVEEWRDMDALAAHLKTPHVGRLVAALPELADGRIEVRAHQVTDTGPLPL